MSPSDETSASTQPFVVRLVAGDITRVAGSLVVVPHFNGLRPTGAEAAVDAALGGAISRRARHGALDGHFAAAHMLPAANTSLPADSVLVLSLGDPEKFSPRRLPELGACIVEFAATFQIRDVATVGIGAGSAGVDPATSACELVNGVLAALETVPGAGCLRELSLVELDPGRCEAIRAGLAALRVPSRLHLYVEKESQSAAAAPPVVMLAPRIGTVPEHLRLGITRSGTDLKLTVIGDGAYDSASDIDFPADLADGLPARLQSDVLFQADADARRQALRSIGQQLSAAFIDWDPTLGGRLRDTPYEYLVLRVDEWTVDLPWEIAFRDNQFLSRARVMARQLEVYAPGRTAAVPSPNDELSVLVIGNPTGDLPSSAREARHIVKTLRSVRRARVKAMIGGTRQFVGGVSYGDVSRELDAAPYDIIHYAGHARFSADSSSVGGLVLKDERLLTSADLSTRNFLPRLFFANACSSADTSRRPQDDLFSGARPARNFVAGLLPAGVQAYLGTMWRVDDAAAATFGEVFYRTLFAHPTALNPEPASVGKAVVASREAVIARHGEGEPTWAAYALYGSPWTVLRV